MRARLGWLIGIALVWMVGIAPVEAQTPSFTTLFFNGTTASGIPLATVEIPRNGDGLYINWGSNSPVPGSVPEDNWSAVLVAQVFFTGGRYRFTVGSDDGVRVAINGVMVLDRFIGRTFASDEFEINLPAGTHLIRIEYFDGIDLASLYINWRPVSQGSNLIANPQFDYPVESVENNWRVYAAPDPAQMTFQRRYDAATMNWLFEFYRAPQPPGGNSAVVLQNTRAPLDSGTSLEARLRLGNGSSVRKRATILIHDADFSDFFVCSFWIPPNTPLQPYRVTGSTREGWTAAHFSIYASSADGVGWLQVDDVELRLISNSASTATLCDDPETPPLP
jgi:hypothetical protein